MGRDEGGLKRFWLRIDKAPRYVSWASWSLLFQSEHHRRTGTDAKDNHSQQEYMTRKNYRLDEL